MKESNEKNLENLIQTITEVKLPYWAKTAIAFSVGVTPLVKVIAPLIGLTVVLSFLGKLLGI